MSEKTIIIIAVFCVCGILIWDAARDVVKQVDKKHNIIFYDKDDKDIPVDGSLLIITHSAEDTVFVREATKVDINKYLRRNE